MKESAPHFDDGAQDAPRDETPMTLWAEGVPDLGRITLEGLRNLREDNHALAADCDRYIARILQPGLDTEETEWTQQ